MTEQDLATQLLPAMDSIRGDLRDLMVGAMASMSKPWKDMPEAEQVQLANLIDAHARNVVTRVAILTATAGRPTVMVTLDSLSIDERARGHFTVSKDLAPSLVPYTKQIVAIMAVGPNQFMGERHAVTAQVRPDQPSFEMGGGGAGGHAASQTIQPGETWTVPVGMPAPVTPRASRAKAKPVKTQKRVGSPFAQ